MRAAAVLDPCTSAPRTFTGKVPSAIPCFTHSMKRRGRSAPAASTPSRNSGPSASGVVGVVRRASTAPAIEAPAQRGTAASPGAPVAARSTSSAIALDASARPGQHGAQLGHQCRMFGQPCSGRRRHPPSNRRAGRPTDLRRHRAAAPRTPRRSIDARARPGSPAAHCAAGSGRAGDRARAACHEPALQLSAGTAISTGARYRPQLHELRIAVDQRPRRQRETSPPENPS